MGTDAASCIGFVVGFVVTSESCQEFPIMPVQKSRKTPSKRGMHRSHDGLATPALSTDPQSGEQHLRHRVTPDGFYRGKRIVEKQSEAESQE